MVKKIIPLILASSIVFSCIAPASAADTPTTGEVVNSIVQKTLGSSMFHFAVIGVSTGVGIHFGHPQVGAFLGDVIADGIKEYADYIAAGYTDQDIYDQFTDYNAQLETDFGTTLFFENGFYVPVKFIGAYYWPGSSAWSAGSYASINGDTFTIINYDKYYDFSLSVETLIAPYTGTYEIFMSGGIANAPNEFDGSWYKLNSFSSGFVNEGLSLVQQNQKNFLFSGGSGVVLNGSVRMGFVCQPSSGFSSISNLDVSVNSRPTSLVTPIAIQNPDQTYTVYNNITLVDEGNKVVFDPTTGESITFTDWVYDYESRTYDLTLDGGGSMTVQFGNDSITMTQGDTVTNIFYVQDPADAPGTDDPDNPDNPGTDADVSGFFTWWKNAWNGFVDRLFTVLDGGDLEVILPGEEGNPEDEEDDGWTIFDLFALIRDALWKIIKGVISVVLDGFLGLVDAIASLGDFFDIYDPANPNGIFGVPNGGVDLWS